MARQLLTQPSTTEGILWGHVFYCLVPCATWVQHTADTYLTQTSAIRVMDIFHNRFFSLLWSLLGFLKMFLFHPKALILGKNPKKPQTGRRWGELGDDVLLPKHGEFWRGMGASSSQLPTPTRHPAEWQNKSRLSPGKPDFLRIPPKTLNFSASFRATTSSLLFSI